MFNKLNTNNTMIKEFFNKIGNHIKTKYQEYRDDIIIGFIIATIVGILCKATVHTWFISLWITLLFQIIKSFIKNICKKSTSGLKIHQILIHVAIGIYVSLLFLIW
jgi:undecaprenyl pyrophosphate phosphatase UppP